MSDGTDLEDLRRDQLEDRVRDLEERLEKLERSHRMRNPLPREMFNKFLERLLDQDIEDYGADPFPLLDDVEEFANEARGDISTDSMKENWVAVVKQAQNLEGNPQNQARDQWVALFVDDVKGATGHSRRYCQDLIERLGESDRPGVDWRPHEPAEPSNNNNGRRKQLLVDLDIWGDA